MDFCEKNMVKIDFATVERLVRDSEMLETIKTLIKKDRYLSVTTIEKILGIEAEGK